MRPRTLEEFAEELRRKGDFYEMEFADEILMLVDIETEVAEPYSDLCADIELYAADYSNPTDAIKALEWVGDRSNLLKELEELLAAEGYADCDPDDALRNIFEKLDSLESTLNDLQALIDAQPNGKLTYDL